MKQGANLPPQATVFQKVLELPVNGPEDGGTYICKASSATRTVDLPVHLTVTHVVPSFSGASYLVLPTIADAYITMSIEISFRPSSANGLILYNSQRNGPTGDYVAFGMLGGNVIFQFHQGDNTATIEGPVLEL